MAKFTAIASILLEPASRHLQHIQHPLVFIESGTLRQVHDGTDTLDRTVFAVKSPRTFSLQLSDSFVLIVDSGKADVHQLHVILFSPFERRAVTKAMSLFAAQALDSCRSGAHWYRLSTLKAFIRNVEFYIDSHGDATGIAFGTDWSLAGADAIFRTQKLALGGRTRPACLHALNEVDASRPIRHEASGSGAESVDDAGWFETIKFQERMTKAIKVVPSVRDIFLHIGHSLQTKEFEESS